MIKSRLGQSLLRLQHSLTSHRRQQQQADSAIVQWRNKWMGHRDQIAQRLALIESKLDEFSGEAKKSSPQLTLVGGLADEEA